MHRSDRRRARAFSALLAAAVVGGAERWARADDAPLLMLEGSTGATTPAYADASVGWMVGLAFGPTLRPRRSRLRFHLLGNVQALRSTLGDGGLAGPGRTDVAYFFSQRTVLPVTFPLRVYLETGLGVRQGLRTLPSGEVLSAVEPLIVVALGAQLRWTRGLSVGLRAGLEPLEPARVPADFGREQPTRASLTLTVGAHF